jgi:peptide/nickel transport system ATP-binding protein
MSPILSIRNLTVDVAGREGLARVIHAVSLDITAGETLGIVGESGCGKSLTWLAALKLQSQAMRIQGQVFLDDANILDLDDQAMSRIRGRRIAMIFQDPSASLNPVRTIGYQIGEVLTRHRGLSGGAIASETQRLLESVGIADAPNRLRQYPHEFSGGMNQRAMIAMALAGRPDILIADEPTTALDVTIQAQILELLRQIQRETGMAIVLISHDLGVVSDICERIAVMYAGRIVEMADTESIFSRPSHPYTRGLLAAFPDVERPKRKLSTIPGAVPGPGEVPQGCPFLPRCADKVSECGQVVPAFASVAPRHFAACHRSGQGAGL